MKKEDAKVFMEQIKDDISLLNQIRQFNCLGSVTCDICPFNIEGEGCLSGEANERLIDLQDELQQLRVIRRAFKEGDTHANH